LLQNARRIPVARNGAWGAAMFEYVLVGLALLVLVGLPRAFGRRKGRRGSETHDDRWRDGTSAVSWSSADAPSSGYDSGSCAAGDSSSSSGGDCGGSDSGGSSSD
jgi:hypothetical protein